MTDMPGRYSWYDTTGTGRNRFAAFRFSFDIQEPANGQLNLFADAFYHLYVNGRFIQFGPSRFHVKHPRYDVHDLSGLLRSGRNTIAVLVNAFGEMTFKSNLSIGGMRAWGTVEDGAQCIDLATPGAWKAIRHGGFESDSPKFSFPLNALEVHDQAAGPGDWTAPDYDDASWPTAVPLTDQDHWGPLKQRNIPFMDGRELLPRRVVRVFRIIDDEDEYAFRIPFWYRDHPEFDKHVTKLYASTWLHAPRAMDLEIGLYWGDYWINGERIAEERYASGARTRIMRPVHLNEGWNALFAQVGAWEATLDFIMRVPREAGITVSADRDPQSDNMFRISRPLTTEEYEQHVKHVPVPFGEDATFPEIDRFWRAWKKGVPVHSPARQMDLFKVEPVDWPESPYKIDALTFKKEVFPNGFLIVFDQGNDELLRPSVSFSGVRGAVIDSGYSERLHDNQQVDLFFGHPMNHGADRFLATDDEITWSTFHPRGYRYIQYAVRNAPGDVKLRRIVGYRAGYPVRETGWFQCSDPAINRIWEICQRTQRVNMEDAYIDCPLRERGLYGRDAMIQYFNNLALFGDHALMRHCLELFIESMEDHGFMKAVVPIDRDYVLFDYSLDVVIGFLDYIRYSGDRGFAEVCADAAVRAVKAMDVFLQPCGLLSANVEDMREQLTVQGYGVNHSDNKACRDHHDKSGLSCNFNALWAGSMNAAAELCAMAGQNDQAVALRRRAESTITLIRDLLWDESKGLYADNQHKKHHSVQANAAAVLHGIALSEQIEGIRRMMARELEDNFYAHTGPEQSARVSPHYTFYILDALYRLDLSGTAEKVMRRCWGWMLDRGATTTFEFFSDKNSLCHAWASSPAWYLARDVLGVQVTAESDCIRVTPKADKISWAQGVYPHPRGPIEVTWRKVDGVLKLDVKGPDGLPVVIPTSDQTAPVA